MASRLAAHLLCLLFLVGVVFLHLEKPTVEKISAPFFFSKGPPKQPTHPGHLGYDSDLLELFNLIHPSFLLMLQKSGAFCGSLGVGSFICLMHFNPMIYPRF